MKITVGELFDIKLKLFLAARWTVLLSIIAFIGGGLVGLASPYSEV
ncbi:hypothetical protein [Vibrio sp. EA2]|nr:hypothetical protein [Vibrio sp. EA2]MDV6250060.1 hypothetical protein [Vibrio sp. EA2]